MPSFDQMGCMNEDDDVINATIESANDPNAAVRSRIIIARSECSDTTSVFSTPTKTNRLLQTLQKTGGKTHKSFATACHARNDSKAKRSLQFPLNTSSGSKKKTSQKRNAAEVT